METSFTITLNSKQLQTLQQVAASKSKLPEAILQNIINTYLDALHSMDVDALAKGYQELENIELLV